MQFQIFFLVKPYVSIYLNSSQNITLTGGYLPDKRIRRLVENSSDIILCTVNANPRPFRIQWYKDGLLQCMQPLLFALRLQLIRILYDICSNFCLFKAKTSYEYEITRINKNHRGLYRCYIENIIGNGQDEIELDVQCKIIYLFV
jgi:hypothetical protein